MVGTLKEIAGPLKDVILLVKGRRLHEFLRGWIYSRATRSATLAKTKAASLELFAL